jgi:hypothetical protein
VTRNSFIKGSFNPSMSAAAAAAHPAQSSAPSVTQSKKYALTHQIKQTDKSVLGYFFNIIQIWVRLSIKKSAKEIKIRVFRLTVNGSISHQPLRKSPELSSTSNQFRK